MASSSPDGARDEQPPSHVSPPRIWLVLGDKRGDNAQAEVVAEALTAAYGWPCERKQLAMRGPYVEGKPRVAPSLHHIDPERSDALAPPWPNLIVTVGRRPSMAALWVREQSGGQTKIVQIGKPAGRVEWYDLVVASAEIVLPPLPNVLSLTLPLMKVDRASLAEAGALWQPRFAELPRPLTACLIGGPTQPYVYDSALAERLLAWAEARIAETGGSVYFVTSRRTPQDLVAKLKAELPERATLCAWSPEMAENPYRGLLALADDFLVTGDSVSMMVEVIKAGKPLAILPLKAGLLGTLDLARRALVRRVFALPALGRLLYRLRLATHTRDFRNFHRLLRARGLADTTKAPPRELPDERPAIVAHISDLLERR